jgi:surface protein
MQVSIQKAESIKPSGFSAVWLLVASLLLLGLPISANAQVTFEQKSNPAGLFTSTSATKNINDSISTITPNLSINEYSFTHWTLNDVRENAPDGQAKNKISATITENTVAIAHYLATNQDSDSDGVPDWFEIRMFATLDHNGSYDGDGDGVSLADERQFGLAATIADDFLEGGASIRRSGLVFANFGGAKKLSVSSDPAGLFTSSETFPETNSSYSSTNLNGLTNGYYFSHWEVNGVRQADSKGIGLSKISLTMNEDKTVVAKYYHQNEDSDSDGLPDWFEWHEFGTLDHNSSSDPDGDGLLMSEERQFGLSAVITDDFLEGGASIRRSGLVFANFGGAKKLSVSSDPAGLFTSSETFPETNSSYSSTNLNGLTNGYYFSHWEVNGVRQADSKGIGLSKISLTMNEDKTVVAKYYHQNEDSDSDGLPDWFEWHEFGTLDHNSSSDPDGDGLLMSEERQFGLSAVIADDFLEGGGSIRRSGTFGYIEFQPNEDDDGDGLTKAQELQYGTSDDNTDSDGDGFPDGEEVTTGSDPANADSVPNRPPRDLNATAVLAFHENQPVGTVIGEFNATDPDGHAITYYFINGENNNSLFTLDTNGTLKTATTFDYESNASSYTITIQAKDELNATTEGNFTVTLLDLYEDTDGDGFRDSLEASTGSNLNDPNSTPLQQGLVAWYPFDGNASDMSGNGNHGTVNGATLGTDRHGVAGNAYSFDGVDDWIEVSSSEKLKNLSEYSISLWAFAHNFSKHYNPLLNKSSGAISSFELYGGNGFTVAHNRSSSFKYHYFSALPSSKWNHLSLTYRSGVLSKYDDGEFEISYSGWPSPEAHDFSIYFGKQGFSSLTHFLDGSIDDIRIYNRALSADEINVLYNYEKPKLDLNDSNFHDAINLWFTDELNATWTYGHISDWNVSAVTDMSNAFMYANARDFNQPIGSWDTSSVSNMTGMFRNTRVFNQPIGDWNTSSVTNMKDMFYNARGFDQPIGDWDTSSVTDMSSMFYGTVNFNHSVRDWNTSNVNSMESMFRGAVSFNQSIGDWDTSAVTSTSFMFDGARDFNQPISDWNTSNVNSMRSMFRGAVSFNQSIGDWDTYLVTDIAMMFYEANAFDQSLAEWNVTRVSTFNSMWTNAFTLSSSNKGLIHENFSQNQNWSYDWSALVPPRNLASLAQLAILENQPIGTTVGEFNATDANDGNITYHFLSGENKNSLFTLDTNGTLKTATTFDYESNASTYTITVQAKDELNATTEGNFTVTLLNVVEDKDQGGVEDHNESDDDNDGFSNKVELESGTDPNDPFSLPKIPILETFDARLDKNNTFVLSGRVLESGDANVTDFGIIISTSIDYSSGYWIRGKGNPETFRLKLADSNLTGTIYYRSWAKNVAGYGVGPVKKVEIPAPTKGWWGESRVLTKGWVMSDWFGLFRTDPSGWIYHEEMNWIYHSESADDSVWLWKKGRGWLWTKEKVWPYLWSNRKSNWLYFIRGNRGRPLYFDYSSNSYEED